MNERGAYSLRSDWLQWKRKDRREKTCSISYAPHVRRLLTWMQEEDTTEIRTGRLQCRGCGSAYPITRSVPRFVDADAYVDTFSMQRRYVRERFADYVNDQSGHELFFSTTGFETSDIAGELILEIGCGYGRFVDVVQQHEGAIIGIDLSTDSIDLAQEFVGHKRNVHLVQCDLFHLPFRSNTFGGIFSIGVLHHTPDTRKAFEALLPYLQPGKPIAIWVYHPHNKASVNRWRHLTGHLSPKWRSALRAQSGTVFVGASLARRLPVQYLGAGSQSETGFTVLAAGDRGFR